MKKAILAGALAALTLAAGGAVMAQQAPAEAPTPRAMRADANADSRISQAEFVGQRIQRLTAADANGDGAVTADERRAAAEARKAGRADTRFQRLDANGDGAISRAEFDAPRAGTAEARPQRAARHAGRMAQRSQRAEARGPVSIAEARAKAEQAFTRLDADRDGFITAAERRAGMQAVREQRREGMAERRAARQARTQASPTAPASE